MPATNRKNYKHVIIYDTDKTKVLANGYFPTYDDIFNYIVKNYPQYTCPISALQAIANNRINDKYNHLFQFIKILSIAKNDIPKSHVIMAI